MLYCWCRVAVFQLQLLDQHLLLVCWEVRVCTRSWVFLPLFPAASKLRGMEERWWLFIPRTHHVSNVSCICVGLSGLTCASEVTRLSLVSCFVDSCWVSGGQHPAAGSGWRGVTSCCASEPCCAVRRRDTQRKLCCPVVAAHTWGLCWKGPSQLTT